MVIFYIFAAFQLYLSIRSFTSGIKYLDYFKDRLAKPALETYGNVLLVLPCKGNEPGLEENLRAVMSQDYSRYDVVFVLESEQDSARPIIESLTSEFPNAKLVYAGRATESGQKVHNLIAATVDIHSEISIIVFADSDARPDPNWLRFLCSPLLDEKNVCATGYRWFITDGGLASGLRSAWNAPIASAMGESSQFCWGGATALRRRTFDDLNIRDRWKGTLSDDYVIAKCVRESGAGIVFVPQCLTPTFGACRFSELLEFTTRQMKITRVYAKVLWAGSLVGSLLFTIMFWGAALSLPFIATPHKYFVVAFLIVIFGLGTAKADFRYRAANMVLGRHFGRSERIAQIALWAFIPIIFLFNDLAAMISRQITWRGVTYELESDERTKICRGSES